jgi:REP element-mobilizing transposase RayT
MATARRKIVTPDIPSAYFITCRCNYAAELFGETTPYRKGWVEDEIFRLINIMAIDLFAHSVLSNHYHILIKIRPDIVKRWSAEEVAKRYFALCPSSRKKRPKGVKKSDPPTQKEINWFVFASGKLKRARKRLSCVSFFMQRLNHRISCLVHADEGVKGRLWESRFHSRRVVDAVSFLRMMIYIDINLLRAGMVRKLEDSRHTSIRYRIEKFLNRCPPEHETRAALLANLQGVSMGDYLKLVDVSARRITPHKYSVPESEPSIEDRLGISGEQWERFVVADSLQFRGTVIGTEESMAAEAKRRGLKWIWNTFTKLT